MTLEVLLVLQSVESALLTELPQGRSLFSEEGAERPLDVLGRSIGGKFSFPRHTLCCGRSPVDTDTFILFP